MDKLEPYRAKRNFAQTPEPSGTPAKASGADAGGAFVVHKHAARRLHYDLRLEHDGVLWSWAVTRGPSLDPAEKRLAVHVEDHPLDYRSFEGVIPKGYGAGTMLVWDEGTWAPEFDPAWGMQKGHLRFDLHGQKLRGLWDLVRLKPKPGEKRDNWLLIKADDRQARSGGDILEKQPRSVKSGRTVEEVAAGKPPRRKPKRAPMPGFIEPELARLRDKPPEGGDWLHEVKFDGYRIQAHVSGGKTTLYTRSGLDWTGRFGEAIARSLASLDCHDAIIDGEIVVMSDKGVASFPALQATLSGGQTDRMLYYAFDLLWLDGIDLRQSALVERKTRLEALIGTGNRHAPVHFSEHFSEPGRTMLAHVCRMGLEGIISKRGGAPYQSGRSTAWVKAKCSLRQEFVIVGYVPSTARGRALRSLVVGYNKGGRLHYGGRVGTGFAGSVADDLRKRLDRIPAKKAPVDGAPPKDKQVRWVKPKLVCEVEFRGWSDDGILRQASFQGLRDDKPAREVVAESASAPAEDAPARRSDGRAPGRIRGMSVKLTSPDKLLWPEAGLSKAGLLHYYEKAWPRMERFVVGRPLSLVRAPDGIDGQRFFQKHASKGMHPAIIRTADPEDGEELLSIREFDGLAALVQFGVVEVHIWGSTLDAIEQPDQMVFDLDPDEGLVVEDVRAAALDVIDRLDALGLPSFVKTSGGKGFHVVVPLKPSADWSTVKTFTHDFARAMEQADPGRYTSVLSKKARKNRIFIDYLRNGRGSTAVAPWSSRAKPKATVAVPITRDMLRAGAGPADFTIGSAALERALDGPDPWADFFKAAKPLKL
ncbi:DNA ligase D [Mesorhizobium sp. ZMM04-5]|uniref:DNA ligase (ATP) n=1 Tax=Mesorhizobium marinum TaxID=3228790 RepID=A0ABV3QYC3_9HYPH